MEGRKYGGVKEWKGGRGRRLLAHAALTAERYPGPVDVLLGFAAILAGGIASVAGFGIGSILTPAMTLFAPAGVAVAAVSIPHLFGTIYRFWLIREHLDRAVLRSFGAMSALGGLTGALVGTVFSSRALEMVLATLLAFVGIGGLIGFTKRLEFQGIWAWLAGALSGFLGGLVGNQGGLRSGAMMGLKVSRDAFVATATATGLIVDGARMPVYLAAHHGKLLPLWPEVLIMTGGVALGTFLGMKVLRRIPESKFYPVVSVLLLLLSAWLWLKV